MFKLRPFKNSDAACMPSWIIDEREFYFWSAGKFTYPLTADQIIAYAEVMAVSRQHAYDSPGRKWVAGRTYTIETCGLPAAEHSFRICSFGTTI